ncbi:MAG: alpha/beta hydrolase [Myxococcota bacterium]
MRRLVAVMALVSAMAAAAWPGARADDTERRIHERWVHLEGPTGETERAYVVFPFRNDRAHHAEGERYPLVVALHGRGEISKGPERGPRGWIVDYRLPDAFGALQRGEVNRKDYSGFVTRAHLRAVNAELARRAFEGAMIVMPYVRDVSDPEAEVDTAEYADWVAGPLLERVREEFPQAAGGRESVGIDGVSLGGWLALETGFRHPEVFGAVGGIQPAVRDQVRGLVRRAAEIHRKGRSQHVRLVTSEEDPYLAPTRKLSRLLRQEHVPHSLVVLPGPHDYEFNRGPGSLELLRFHGTVLKREPLPDDSVR